MLTTRICPKCGWVYPLSYTKATCKFCHTIIPSGLCRHCGRYTEHLVSDRMLCRVCYNLSQAMFSVQHNNRIYAKLDESFDTWLEQIKDLPSPHLTEAQWNETCAYFNGCAVCGSEHIDTRTYFIPFKLGGKYTVWNVFPTCERCNKIWPVNANPFRNTSSFKHYKSRDFVDTGSFNKLVEYLQSKIQEVSK